MQNAEIVHVGFSVAACLFAWYKVILMSTFFQLLIMNNHDYNRGG